ncbi:MAG: aspartate--ammonia ligase [Clostridia bacterium]|nr:aspartate--ammonia ligase [Clostridia bacterium]
MNELGLLDTQRAIKDCKDTFINALSQELDLSRVSAPLFVLQESGFNDNLNGVERPVSFDIKESGKVAEVVHSLAKWKRFALKKYGFAMHKGLYTDMNAIRRDEIVDNIHSIYVDQWDWEKVISAEDRNLDYLKDTVKKIYKVIKSTCEIVRDKYLLEKYNMPSEISFVTTQELEDTYHNLTPQERENAAAKRYGAVFIMQIGGLLKSGKKHDGRAPDYDDWSLNGDIFVDYPVIGRGLELSSMGIRVDRASLLDQLQKENAMDRLELPFHTALANGKLPLSIGGGIGQSRLCMFMLGKRHIGEVQPSIWSDREIENCKKQGITLL